MKTKSEGGFLCVFVHCLNKYLKRHVISKKNLHRDSDFLLQELVFSISENLVFAFNMDQKENENSNIQILHINKCESVWEGNCYEFFAETVQIQKFSNCFF